MILHPKAATSATPGAGEMDISQLPWPAAWLEPDGSIRSANEAMCEAFGEQPPDAILSANIGCITHLQSGTATPVWHWVEVLDEALRVPA